MWNIGQAIREHQYIEIEYKKMKGKETVARKLKPVAIMFSEYYFYLTAFIDDKKVREDFNILEDSFPTIYRMDRIHSLKISKEKFNIPYKDRFEEGEFRKRIQFMYGGPLQKYALNTVEFPLKQCLTACRLQGFCMRMKADIRLRQKCLERGLRCGYGARES